MPRLFVAINLPGDVRSTIWDAFQDVRSEDLPVRWVKSELLHLTVKFLGDVERSRIGSIERQLEEAAADVKQHSIGLDGVGAFPSLQKPQTIWAGCEPVPALELLQHGVEHRLADVGFPVEGRPFRPHVTVGRVKRGTPRKMLDGFAGLVERVQLATVALVSSVDLMESQLGPGGPRYRVMRAFEFGA